jgi:hypothetical protein
VCGFLALALALFTEWRFEPFIADAGLGYFLSHVHHLQPLTPVMIAVGTLIGFYVPFGRGHEERKPGTSGEIPPAETTEK